MVGYKDSFQDHSCGAEKTRGVVEVRDNRIGVGIVGYGYWGPNLVRNYLECKGCLVKYICDKSSDQLRRAAMQYPSIIATQHYKDLLNDPEVNAIVIATPISTHYLLGKEAIMHGKHVFIEKPLAATSRQAEELVELAERKKVTLMVGHTFVFSPPVAKTKEIIESGELGNIYYISSSRVNLGLHQSDASVIWDLAPHDLSILFYWLGEEPVSIQAFGRACITPHIPDVAFINLNFPSGIVAELQLSWLSPVKLRRTMVIGNKKMLLYDDTENVEKVKIFDHGVNYENPKSFGEFQLSYRTGDIVAPHLDSYEPLFAEANHFLECIATGKKPRTDGQCGLEVVRVLEKAEKSLVRNGNFGGVEQWSLQTAHG